MLLNKLIKTVSFSGKREKEKENYNNNSIVKLQKPHGGRSKIWRPSFISLDILIGDLKSITVAQKLYLISLSEVSFKEKPLKFDKHSYRALAANPAGGRRKIWRIERIGCLSSSVRVRFHVSDTFGSESSQPAFVELRSDVIFSRIALDPSGHRQRERWSSRLRRRFERHEFRCDP